MADEEAMSSSSSNSGKQPWEQKLAEAAYMAKVAEEAERYDDMTEYMSVFVLNAKENGYELNLEERNLLSLAYKNAVGARRAAWRIVLLIEQKEESQSAERVSLARDYRGKIEAELDNICGHILDLLDKSLIPSATSPENKVFYLKMKGDYHRYRAELKSSELRKEAADNTMDAYNAANEIAVGELTCIHPIRLGLALNISVFYYEILNNVDKACQTAKQAFDEALAALKTVDEESYKDTTLIMQLLRDNLTLWNSEVQDKTDEA